MPFHEEKKSALEKLFITESFSSNKHLIMKSSIIYMKKIELIGCGVQSSKNI